MDPVLEAFAAGTLDEYLAGVEDLDALFAEVRAAAVALREGLPEADNPDEVLASLETLAEIGTAIKAAAGVRAEAALSREERADAATAIFGDDPVEEDEDDTPEEPAPEPEPEPEVEPAGATAAQVGDTIKRMAARRPAKAAPKATQSTRPLVAAAVGDAGLGATFADPEAVYEQMWDQARRGPNGYRAVARIPRPSKVMLDGDPAANMGRIADVGRGFQAARNRGDTQEALVAAGFCAPAQPTYDYFKASAAGAGLLTLPEVGAPRGRVTIPEAISPVTLTDAGIGSQHTEAEDIAATPKPCFTVVCGDNNTWAVDAYSTCLVFSNFDSQFFPERVANVTAESMVRHSHDVNAALIQQVLAQATFVVDGFSGGGTVVGLLRGLAQASAYYRIRHKMAIGAVLEAVLPAQTLWSFAADIAARQSSDAGQDMSLAAAKIEGLIRSLGVNPQWVYDWQEPAAGQFDGFIDALMFAPGTVVRLNGGTLDLGVVRDSTLNLANDFQVFTEEFVGIAVAGYEILRISGLENCPNGVTGAASTLACIGS